MSFFLNNKGELNFVQLLPRSLIPCEQKKQISLPTHAWIGFWMIYAAFAIVYVTTREAWKDTAYGEHLAALIVAVMLIYFGVRHFAKYLLGLQFGRQESTQGEIEMKNVADFFEETSKNIRLQKSRRRFTRPVSTGSVSDPMAYAIKGPYNAMPTRRLGMVEGVLTGLFVAALAVALLTVDWDEATDTIVPVASAKK